MRGWGRPNSPVVDNPESVSNLSLTCTPENVPELATSIHRHGPEICHDKFGPPGPYISEIYGPQFKNVDPHTSSQEFLSKCSDVDNNILLSCTMNNGSIYIHNMAHSRFKLASSPGSFLLMHAQTVCTPPSFPLPLKRIEDLRTRL